MKVYLAANFDGRSRILRYADLIENGSGIEVVGNWFKSDEAAYPGGQEAAFHALDCLSFIAECDVFVQFVYDFPGKPSQGGKQVELGYAIARGKHIVIVGEPKNIFHCLPDVQVVPNIIRAVRLLESMRIAIDAKRHNDILKIAQECKRDEGIRAVAEYEPVIDWFRREGGVL